MRVSHDKLYLSIASEVGIIEFICFTAINWADSSQPEADRPLDEAVCIIFILQ